jgi:hypothetical protein
MKPWPRDLVAAALAAPANPPAATAADWTALVQQGRRAGLLARIAAQAATGGLASPRPAGVTGHFESALRLGRAQQAEVRREVAFILQALQGLGAPVVLLKGAAYVMAGLPAASGRVFGDIDIMVPKAVLAPAESMLTQHGWMSSTPSAYDQRYYRQWMHELPPLQHVHRGTALDLHHAIVPQTARLRPDPRKLFERALPVPGHPGLQVLAPEDMVLHAMTHLFLNDDTSFALRDLSDLDLLLREFGPRAGFWEALVRRAVELDLTRPLYYGLRHCTRVLGTPVPAQAAAEVRLHAPAPPLARLMDAIWSRALRSPHPSARAPGTAAALFALLVRGHWMRMPAALLVRHLAVKALRLGQAGSNRRTEP